jgi:hypothetical protein
MFNAVLMSASVALSASLTFTPPKPRNPPSDDASAIELLIDISQVFTAATSCGALASRIAAALPQHVHSLGRDGLRIQPFDFCVDAIPRHPAAARACEIGHEGFTISLAPIRPEMIDCALAKVSLSVPTIRRDRPL